MKGAEDNCSTSSIPYNTNSETVETGLSYREDMTL